MVSTIVVSTLAPLSSLEIEFRMAGNRRASISCFFKNFSMSPSQVSSSSRRISANCFSFRSSSDIGMGMSAATTPAAPAPAPPPVSVSVFLAARGGGKPFERATCRAARHFFKSSSRSTLVALEAFMEKINSPFKCKPMNSKNKAKKRTGKVQK